MDHLVDEGGLNFIDFSRKSNTLKEWNGKDPIDRENFVDFLIQSFNISGGFPTIQSKVFIWAKINLNFDYDETALNLIENGGWNAFTQEEQSKFLDAFKSIPAHSEKVESFSNNPGEALGRQLNLHINNDLRKMNEEQKNEYKVEFSVLKARLQEQLKDMVVRSRQSKIE